MLHSSSLKVSAIVLARFILVQSICSQESPVPTRQLAQPAPYLINNSEVRKEPIEQHHQDIKNMIFRLSYNRSATSGQENQQSDAEEMKNATLLGSSSRVNLDLKKLLVALNNNNISNEVKFFDDNNLVNITITNLNNNNSQDNKVYLLEELMLDSRIPTQLNSSSIIKDNHKSSNDYTKLYHSRSKLPNNLTATSSANSSSQSLLNHFNQITSLSTAPPIRTAIEVVAENYTMRKIADEANIFALKLLNQLNIEQIGAHNLIQPTFSVYQGLTLLLAGSMGETSKELDKVLLGIQSSYENIRLTHDQDRVRLLASLGDVMRQLQLSSSHHFKYPNGTDRILIFNEPYFGGTKNQHLIVANNLLFSPASYEISNEFKSILNTNYNQTTITKMEVGSTESVQLVNSWIRKVTNGLIPHVMNRKATFDEYNVMTLLSSNWLMQEWKDKFYRIAHSIRNSIRLKGQGTILKSSRGLANMQADETLLEFVDDNKQSHFVEYIKSRPSRHMQHYHAILNGIMVDVVVVPFRDSNHKMITMTPLQTTSSSTTTTTTTASNNLQQDIDPSQLTTALNEPYADLPDSSLLSRLISALASNPRKAMRSLWAVVAPDIITKHTYQNIQLAKQMNVTIDEKVIETTITPLVQLSMPMISTNADYSISAALNHIGIVNAFDRDQANFIGINGHPFNYYKLHLSNVLSKTTFNLDERGINYDRTIKSLASMRIYPERKDSSVDDNEDEIESASEKAYTEREFIDEVKLNKPYVYMVADMRTKLILYTGIMRNPQEQAQATTS